jgi:hypothetical protein
MVVVVVVAVGAADVDRQSCNHHPRKNPGQTDGAGCREMVAASPAIAADVFGTVEPKLFLEKLTWVKTVRFFGRASVSF